MQGKHSNFKLTILLIACVLIALPIFFERLHSDEAFYWDISHNLFKGNGLLSGIDNRPYVGHMPLPLVLAAPFSSLLGEHIYTVRFVAALFTIGCAVLIFLISQSLYSQNVAFISSLLFLTSFQALRFGGRFYLDQFGAFFFLLAVFLLLKKRYFLAGLFAALMILGREYWLGIYPFFIIYLLMKKEPITTFVLPFIIILLGGLFYAASTVGLSYFYQNQFTVNTLKRYLNPSFLQENAVSLFKSWLEVFIVNVLTFVGFFYAWNSLKENKLWLLVLPQFVVVSMIYGFIVNGGVTQYPLGLVASMSIFAGHGLHRIWNGFPPISRYQKYFVPVVLVMIAFQFIGLNIVATKVTLHQNWGIWGFGYKDDAKIISLLREKAAGEYIYGIHGAFVEDRSRWNWTDFGVQQAIREEPDWLITFDNYVRFKQPKENSLKVEIYHIGPYLVFHSHPRGHLSELIAQTEFPKWRFRK